MYIDAPHDMKNNLFTVAIKDGRYTSIEAFAPGDGEKCGCICPECGEPVRSNVTSKSKEKLKINYTNHFSHIDENSTCTGGFLETEIHLTAKKIISSNSTIWVPGENKEKMSIQYTKVRVEPAFPNVDFKRYRPDIIMSSSDNEDIAIEVVVTCPVTALKEELYKKYAFKSFTIDLSHFQNNAIDQIETELRSQILMSVERKKWIWPEPLPETITDVVMPKVEGHAQVNKKPSIRANPLTWVVAIAGGILFLKQLLGMFSRSNPFHRKRRK